MPSSRQNAGPPQNTRTDDSDSQKCCDFCANSSENSILEVSELMLQTGDTFHYLHCSNCGALQLINPPSNMSDYYPADYYSFKRLPPRSRSFGGLVPIVRRAKLKNLLGISNKLDNLLSMGKTPHFPWMCPGLIDLDSKILDVGCGSGFLLEEMAAYGLKGLYGIDLFANISVQAHSNIHFKQCSLSDYELTEFDLVMFHHSFEHFADPIETLCAARDRLADRGTILIRIPVADSDAFEKYRENWVHLDAPRHYFVPTQKSVEILADSCHLKLVGHYRDSNGFGIVGSECYLRGLPLGEESSLFSAKELAAFQAEAEYLNYENRGDSACFYLKRSET